MNIGSLVITNGQGQGKRFLLENLSVFEGGRSLGSHIFLKDESVAHCHFRIYRNNQDYTIHDLGTSKGTIVNGQRVEKAALAHGDLIRIGDVELRFDHQGASPESRSTAPGAEKAEPDSASPAEPVSMEKLAVPALTIIDGNDKGRTFVLSGKDRFKIGRAMSSDLKLTDGKISREHCLVETVRDHHIIIDLDSSNGTVVNGERVKKTVLKEGDYIRLGFTMLKYDRV